MLYKQKFPYEKLNRETDSETGIRHYETPSGWVPSVTTILSATGDKTGLNNWVAWKGEKEANRIRDEAAALGTVVHDNMEAFLLERERPGGSNFIYQLGTKMSDVLITEGFKKVEEVWAIEEPLYMDGLYAGTSDLIGVYNGKETIFDWKNTIKMKLRKFLGDYRCQASAYALAHNHMFGTNIEQIAIMMVDRQLQFEAFVFETEEFNESAAMWVQRLEEWYA